MKMPAQLATPPPPITTNLIAPPTFTLARAHGLPHLSLRMPPPAATIPRRGTPPMPYQARLLPPLRILSRPTPARHLRHRLPASLRQQRHHRRSPTPKTPTGSRLMSLSSRSASAPRGRRAVSPFEMVSGPKPSATGSTAAGRSSRPSATPFATRAVLLQDALLVTTFSTSPTTSIQSRPGPKAPPHRQSSSASSRTFRRRKRCRTSTSC